MRRIFTLSAIVILLLTPSRASADIYLCNRYNQRIWMTYGYESYGAGGKCHNWVRGWFPRDPNQCAKVRSGCLCNWWSWVFGDCPYNVLRFFGEPDDMNGFWGGTQSFNTCTPWSAFEYCAFPATSCPDGRLLAWGSMTHDFPICDYTFNFLP